LSRRSLPSGLCHAAPRQPLYRALRSSKNRQFEKALPGVLPRAADSRRRQPIVKTSPENAAARSAYFVDAEGRIRHHHFGEHDYENSERVIQKLLMEAGNRNVPSGFVTASNAAPLTLSALRTDPR